MFVLTVDQRDSRSSPDLVGPRVLSVNRAFSQSLIAPAERTVGDEFQVAVSQASVAIQLALSLARENAWHVGIGIGDGDVDPSQTIRSGSGAAFIAARRSVTAAKKSRYHCVVSGGNTAGGLGPTDAQAVLDLILSVRERRSPEGWELVDALQAGTSQQQAAAELGITAGAVSQRKYAARIDVELAGITTLGTLLDRLNSLDQDDRNGAHPL